jgi:hypothetical protein
MKYTTVKVSGVVIQIATTTDIPGYTEGVLEIMLPNAEMSEKEVDKWIKESNKRAKAICKFLNEVYEPASNK